MAKKTVKKTASPSKKTSAKKAVKKTTKKASSKKKTKKGNNQVDLECFLSTACMQYKHLPDNCKELQLLRSFRDTYLRSSEQGNRLVEEYYGVGPKLVQTIESHADKGNTYRYIYTCIQKACEAIEQEKNKTAQNIYLAMVKKLTKDYLSQ